ncbi:type II toxin-antitoxin system HipA family toxin [Pantoea phytobeneficialis]|uniref:Serine/threonine protein kinase n=1 Tax=Pantoea phytobeneficialis TaxID=2052056 RepID=A0AAP9H9Q2_9GAMM|nr:type II toxin-antitoxin system HipA family toxin [Pantoea phytobeneficialis]MDO6408792.1 type II toxin-antitoxin system HipA family toxin [Pantoea phytobeneficialis]QGR09395.1 serine/threonine protein kinase [Pantoea phytobeneficialis]
MAWMNGERVGVFTRQSNGAHTFQYAESWLDNRLARPLSLSLPLQLPVITSESVINYFDNLLPDSPLIRDRIVARYRAKSRQPFDLLREVGKDSVGAVMLLPTDSFPSNQGLQYETLNEEKLIRVLSAYQADIPLGMIRDEEDFRISVAGAQEKTALLKTAEGWSIPHGSTPTSHIIKLPIGEIKQPFATLDMRESVENEYACLALARALGFNVPAATIIHAGNIRALAVERFDRRWNAHKTQLLRLPQEDMCQTFGLPSALKYESDGGPGIADIMAFLMGSSQALEDRDAFMKFQVFQWLIGATDGHAKNFSVFIERGGSYRLTPFYDVISAYPVLGGTGLNIRDLKLAMGLKATKGKKMEIDKIFPRHFIATAKAVNFDPNRMVDIIDFFIAQLPTAIHQVERILPADFPPRIADALFSNSLRMLARLQQ